ncbi:MAG: DUF2065 domain-containing protein [Pseudomonadota bacterium]
MIETLILAIGLVFVIEGLVWALIPRQVLRFLISAAQAPEYQLRLGGVIAVAIGVIIVWFVQEW